MCSWLAVGEAGIGAELYVERRERRPQGARLSFLPLCGGKDDRARGGGSNTVPGVEPEYLQLNQPPGVPPLPLTGERTLPDVPEENYWYRRHLVVYEWIAARVGGLRVVDLACGEGYGSDVLAAAG